MTLPAAWKRSTAKQRRKQRAEFAALKARLDANPPPEILKHREKAIRDDERQRARRKVQAALSGRAINPFSAKELAKVKSTERDMLRAEVLNRLAQLTAEERKALAERQYLLLACFSNEDLKAIAVPRAA